MTNTPDTESYTDQIMQTFATLHSGITRQLLGLLMTSGQMRTATELQVRVNSTQSETLRALKWLEEWGLVTNFVHEVDDVFVVRYAVTNAGAVVYERLPYLDK